MNDTFYEQLVTRRSGAKDIMIRIGIIAVIAMFLIFTTPMLGFLSLVITILLALGAYYFVFQKLNVEFEYTLLNYDLEIDAIYNKSKRKKLLSFDLRQAEILAPKGSFHLNSYHPDKTLDFTSGDNSNKIFVVITPAEHKNTCILLEPDAKMLSQMKSWMGSKFRRD